MDLLLVGAVLWVASIISPYVQINSLKTLCIATVLLVVIVLLAELLCGLSILYGVVTWNYAIVIAGIILAIFPTYIALGLLSDNLAGFYVADFWPRAILAFILSSISARNTNRTRE